MTIIEVPINDLAPDPANVRTHTDRQIEKLVASLRRWGQTLPLLVDSNNVVRIGNARLDAIRRLGWPTAKVVRLDLSPSEWTALAIADNRLHDESAFDTQALANVLASLRAEDGDLAQAAGYTLDELANLLDGQQQADDQPTPPDDFDSFDETIAIDHQCPRCKYVWSGSSAPQEVA